MSVLDRSALEASPLADLHAIASELGLDGFRRLRKAELVDAIVARQGGEAAGDTATDDSASESPEKDAATGADEDDDEEDRPARARRRRGGRGRGRARTAERDDDGDGDAPRGGGRGRAERDDNGEPRGRGRGRGRAAERDDEPADDGEERTAEGTVELLGNGSGFVRVAPPDPSDDDVYISAAQVRRCELVAGDKVSGPVRRPRRSERYPSLVRVDTINGQPADEVAEGTRYDDLPCGFPTERFELPGEDPNLQAATWLTPFGRGSRVTIVGGPRAGKTELLRRIAGALSGDGSLSVSLVLAGVRPEEVPEWESGPVAPTAIAPLTASADTQSQAVEHAVEQARRVAARGGNAVVLVDGIDALSPSSARRALGSARNIVDGGSLTVVATASAPVGGETTTIALDPALTASRRFPSIHVAASGTLRPELLVGEAGVEAIAKARVEVLGG
jgi:transcription termination factor Rho